MYFKTFRVFTEAFDFTQSNEEDLIKYKILDVLRGTSCFKQTPLSKLSFFANYVDTFSQLQLIINTVNPSDTRSSARLVCRNLMNEV